MLFPPRWVAADGVELWGWAPHGALRTIILDSMLAFAKNIEECYIHEMAFKYKMYGPCLFNGVVRRNTDETLKRFMNNEIDDVLLCQTCRGKGHSWKCKIWNGRPYLGKPTGDKWSHPDKCLDCKGRAIMEPLKLLARQSID